MKHFHFINTILILIVGGMVYTILSTKIENFKSSKTLTSKDATSKDETSKDATSKDATSKDETSKDATSKEATSKEVTSSKTASSPKKKDKKKDKKKIEKFTVSHQRMEIDTHPDRVKHVNHYDDNYENANFGSNVIDHRHFYKFHQYKPNLSSSSNFATPSQAERIDHLTYDPLYRWSSSNEFDTYKPDMWRYKNDFVMNGSKLFDNVHGFSSMDNVHIAYKKMINKDNDNGYIGTEVDSTNCTPALDDIRMGQGIWLPRKNKIITNQ